MLVYVPGQFCLPHRDSEKEDATVGSLVVSVPPDAGVPGVEALRLSWADLVAEAASERGRGLLDRAGGVHSFRPQAAVAATRLAPEDLFPSRLLEQYRV